jgi:hypothetical protein
MFGCIKLNLVKSFMGSLVESHIGKDGADMFFQTSAREGRNSSPLQSSL